MNRLTQATLISLLAACGTAPLSDEATLLPSPNLPESDDLAAPEATPEMATQALAVCGPTAVAYDLGQAPQLPPNLNLETLCTDERPELGLPFTTPATATISWTAATGTLDVRGPELHFGESDGTVFTFDEDLTLAEMHSFGAEGFYTSSFGSTWYRLNEQGELDWKFAASMPTRSSEEEDWTAVLVKEQTWDGDNLLSRTERNGEDGPLVRHFEWSYDERGRLTASRLTDLAIEDFERTYSTTYRYDQDDRLTSLERFVRGVRVEHQTWEWSDDGLVARTYEIAGLESLAAEHGGDPWQWANAGGLDDFELAPSDWTRDPWAAAMGAERGGCAIPPQGPGHGYPQAEAEYDLSWAQDQRPTGIGFAYGSDTYGWFYGDNAWFGHFGLGSLWAPLSWGSQDYSVVGRVEYDAAGRMESESFRFESSLGTLEASRERTRVEGELASDRVEFRVGEESLERELRFVRTDSGAIVSRELVQGGTTLARQSWERDADDKVLELTVEPHGALGTPFFEAVGLSASFGNTETEGAGYRWGYDEEGRVTERSGPESQQRIEYDSSGRVAQVEGYFDNRLNPVRRAFDAAGRVTEECSPRGENDWFCMRSTYDASGRLHATHYRDSDAGEWQLQAYNRYICY